MMKEYIKSDFPLAYSDAVVIDKTIFVAGQGPDSLEVTVEEQIRQTIRNLEKVLSKVEASLKDLVKVTVILNYDKITPQMFEEVYKDILTEPYPARTIIKSDIGFNVQIDAIAVKEKS
ncbi:RidA family protein [Paenibacillus mendelii]|uniref:RidA family protein n=1 Tax=Paenibacillus mendelii TaxID=206163 RepID=A0ABV6JHG9_9BACL|nr:RidA family protein [Paenibacillus mendelii]MCQ6557144.1 RidA family protein [Paenibacillus mendelii]